MNLNNQREYDNTRKKLERLEARYDELRNETTEDVDLHRAELFSLKRLINQFKEEIARFEARQLTRR